MKGLKDVTDGFINDINNLKMLYRSVINNCEEKLSQVVKNLFCLFKIHSQFRDLISMTY